MRNPRSVIKLPHVTEKSNELMDLSWYVFKVDKRANKKEIKDSIEKIFNVKVDKVRTSITAGKKVKRFGRVVGKRSPVKKAYVKLREGAIEIFEGV